MTTTFDVRIWKTDVREGTRVNTYTVRWLVAGQRFKEPHRLAGQAESFRSRLLAAAKGGEAFVIETGLPVSMQRAENDMSWYDFACEYVDMKWAELAGNSRKGVAEMLTNVMPVMVHSRKGRPDDKVIRRALNGWAFNKKRRDTINPPEEVRTALKWLAANSKAVSTLEDAANMRAVLGQISSKLDGTRAASSTIKRKRAVLFNAVEYAVERKLLTRNPIPALKVKVPKPPKAIDKRVVVNPTQAERLLSAVGQQKPSGSRLKAFFAMMYYSAARPGEAVNLRKQDILIPPGTWNESAQCWELPDGVEDVGELLLSESAPETGAAWSETGKRRDKRQLKHREKGDTRSVPCPPQLALLLREHLRLFGTDAHGYLFRGVRGTGLFSESTYSRAWRKARQAALNEEEHASPLARRAYQLRHAAVSTWLNAGVPPQQVAEWAGHSLDVLFKIYAKCLAGQEEAARKRLRDAYLSDA
jgi:integrase